MAETHGANGVNIKKLAQAQSIAFTQDFGTGIKALQTMLGNMERHSVPAGTAVSIYSAQGALPNAQVAENAEITASTHAPQAANVDILNVKKYRKQTSIEKVAQFGYENSVIITDKALIGDIQNEVRTELYATLLTGTGTATGVGLQKAIANAWSALTSAYANENATPVYFANPADVATYLGNANITMQNAFGMSYVQNFLGMGTLVIDPKVTANKVIATAVENLQLLNIDMGTVDGFELTSDETGLIGVNHNPVHNHGSYETTAFCNVKLYPMYLDRVIVGTVTAS